MSSDRRRRELRVGTAVVTVVQTAPPGVEGPRPEKWVFAPGVLPEDIAKAEQWVRDYFASTNHDGTPRAPGSASPLDLVARNYRDERLQQLLTPEELERFERRGWMMCPGCAQLVPRHSYYCESRPAEGFDRLHTEDCKAALPEGLEPSTSDDLQSPRSTS